MDLAATVLDVTGAKPSRSIDGRSLMPFARKPSKRTAAADPARARRRAATVPSGRRRYVWVEHPDGNRELYDRARDPYAARPPATPTGATGAPASTLAKELKRLGACKGKSCRRSTKRIPPPTR